jgi:hypothetical protein
MLLQQWNLVYTGHVARMEKQKMNADFGGKTR